MSRCSRRARPRPAPSHGPVILPEAIAHEVLLINGRDRTQLVDGLQRQIEAVRTMIAELAAGEADVRGALCFPSLDRLPRHAQLTIHSETIMIATSRGIATLARRTGPLTQDLIDRISGQLARRFPPA
jgi:hypothetical protein